MGMVGWKGGGRNCRLWGLLLLQAIFVCVCVYVLWEERQLERESERGRGRERVMRRYEIQLRGHYFLLTHVTRLKVGLEPQTFIMWAHCHI